MSRSWKTVLIVVLSISTALGAGVYYLHEWYPDCSCINSDPRQPPLIAAAAEGCNGCVRSLLRHGADSNLSHLGETPLYAAALHGNTSTARILIKAGANANVGEGWTRPICAAMRTEEATGDGLIKTLVEAGANLQWHSSEALVPNDVFACLVHDVAGPDRREETKRLRYLANHGLSLTFQKLPQDQKDRLSTILYPEEFSDLTQK